MPGLLDRLNRKYEAENRLHAVLVELTHACPCNCLHCLLVRKPRSELTLDEIADLLAQLRQEGTFNLGLTGGEPFLRKDFPRILELVRRDRFFVSVLTTGILVGKPEVELLQRCGVRFTEISLLGAGPETHDAVMRFPGAFERTVAAVKLLRDAGITVCLKTTILRPNRQELPAMARLAEKLGAMFSANISVSPRVDGDRGPQELALDEEEVARLDPTLLGGGPLPDEDHSAGAVLTCRAGRTVAGISPRGDVFPCILMRRKVGNLRHQSLQEIWHDRPDPFLDQLRELKSEDVAECHACELRASCRRCPGVAYLETGQLRLRSPSACSCARGIAAAYETATQK